MSHHFDTKLAKEDPSLNLCDFYLFDGPSVKTVMAMTVNPDLGFSAPDTLHPEGFYRNCFGRASMASPSYQRTKRFPRSHQKERVRTLVEHFSFPKR